MLERIEKGDRGLCVFVKAMMIIVVILALIMSVSAFVLYLMNDISITIAVIPLGAAIIICLCIYLNYYISGLFYLAAYDKGYDNVAYIRVPFFLGLVGYLLVCALPQKRDYK